MKVLGAYRPDAGGYYRMVAPFSVLAYRFPDDLWDIDMLTHSSVQKYDLLWLYQHADPVIEVLAREFKDAGKPIVYDVDDWLFGLPASWPGYDDFFFRGAAVAKDRLHYHKRLLKLADVVTCPTQVLADKLARHCELSDVRVLPNCIVQGDWDTLLPKAHDLDGQVVGWFGTGTHWDDWAEIVNAVAKTIISIDGYLAIIGAPEVVSMFPVELARRTRVQPLVPVDDLRGVREFVKAFDVGLAWCSDRFTASLCRSPLKAIQYGAAGVPVVASKTVYGDLPDFSDYGLAAYEPGGLIEGIKYAVRGNLKRRARAWQAEVWRSHSYETQAHRWLDLARELIEGVDR
jgi:hypothetical protein